MWSVIAPIGVRLVPASHAGRATTAGYVGISLALVVGSPLPAAMSELWGWRLRPYVAAFHVGIMAGSLSGGVLYENAGLAVTIRASAALVRIALACVAVTSGLFLLPLATSEK
jgi:predicted MFS family arabinose efflux permease